MAHKEAAHDNFTMASSTVVASDAKQIVSLGVFAMLATSAGEQEQVKF